MKTRRDGALFGARIVDLDRARTPVEDDDVNMCNHPDSSHGSVPSIDLHRGNASGRKRGRCHRDETGTALVEFALVLPLLALLTGVAFNGWNGMQLDIGLTSAARAGVIQAANDLASDPTQTQAAQTDATTAVNAEQGDTNVYQDTDQSANNYVGMSETTETVDTGVTINVVTITISQVSETLVPFVGSFHVSVDASARYS
jgi:Flp pilus assembly protein TadG